MVIFEGVTDRKRTPTISAYLLTSTVEHLPELGEALTHLRHQYPIVLGDLRANIDQSQNPRKQQVADLLMEFVLMDLLHHFC